MSTNRRMRRDLRITPEDCPAPGDLAGGEITLLESFDTLLSAVLSAPLKEGPKAVSEHFADTLTALLPDVAVGACVVTATEGEPVITLRTPEAAEETGRDPTRLFPSFAHECIFDLTGLEGSTLHLARNSKPIDELSLEHTVAKRAGECLAACINTAVELGSGESPHQETRHLRSQLIQAEKLASFGQLVAGVVHELANPLTSIVAYADYLTKKARSHDAPQEDVQRLERIGEAAERILGFSRDLIAYARPASDSLGPVSLHEIIDRAVVFCEHEFSRREVSISRYYEPNLPAVVGQVGPLTQVFVNLFTNAAHAMADHGGKLVVSTSVEDGEAVAKVTDTGIGIRPEALERVFDPFFTTKEKERGTGLGLTIVREIVRAHFGRLYTASTPGEGTTFTIRLRLFAPRPESSNAGLA